MLRTPADSLVAALRRVPHARAAGEGALAAALLAASVAATGPTLWFWDTPSDVTAKPIGLFGGSLEVWRCAVLVWWAAAIAASAGMLLRRRLPAASFVISGTAVSVHLADIRLTTTPVDLAAAICLYTAALRARSRIRSGALVAAGVALCWIIAVAGQLVSNGSVDYQYVSYLATIPTLALLAAWFAGDAGRARRLHVELLEQRAADLERERDQHAALAAAAERAHLARELHDVVAHGISVMVVQAQAAKAVLRRDRAAAESALDETVSVGRASLAEMRRLVGIAREDPPDAPVPRSPQPGTDRLADLIEQVRRAGVSVDYRLHGRLGELPPAVDLSAYRIVQEALTNTVKHAGPDAHAEVTLAFSRDTLTLEIRDRHAGADACARPSPAADQGGTGHGGAGGHNSAPHGNGLIGIAERVTALGGSLQTAREPHGFLLRAVLPLGHAR